MGDSLAGSRGGGRADERDSLVADGERDGPRRGYRPRRSSRRGRCLPGPATRTGAALTAVASLALVGLPGTALARVQAPQPPGPSLTAATAPGDGARGRQAPPRQAQAPVHLPAGLQAAIDRTLSAEPATSPSGLSLTWGSAGAVSFRPGKAGQGFTLRPVSFGAARLEAFSPGSFVFGQKDVTEALGHGASAWYKASAKGFEQGFTISRPPAGKAGALSIVLSYSGGLHPSSPGPRGFDISGRSGPEMTYGGLRATDATGKALPARLVLGHGTVRITVSDAGAAYPVTVDPFVAPSSAPTATFTGTGTEQLGSSVALSADGQVALVGAPFASSDNGAAYLYTEASGTWPTSPTASFTGTGAEHLGSSVALSADGQTALVGAPFASSGNGTAYLYTEASGTWPSAPTASFTGTGGENLGWSVALSADGQTALVGAPFASSNNGAAYLYAEPASGWPATPSPTASFTGTGGEQLGYSVALSADGQTALVGAFAASSGNGAAYLYTEASGTWPTTPTASFTGTGGENLGSSVALSADGQAALVGAPFTSSRNGAAYLYGPRATIWPPGATATASFTGTGLEELGYSVALSADGQVALVGAPLASSDNGAAYLYAEASGTWPSAPTASFTGTGGEEIGYSVALSADGQAALVGAPLASSSAGAAYLYTEDSGTWPSAPAASFTGTGLEELGSSVALSADGQAALVGAPFASSSNGAAYLYAEPASGWPATPSPAASFTGTGGEQLGYSVALSADGQAALVGAPFASSSNGAAYLYTEASGTWPTTPAASFTGTGSENLGWSVALSADGQAALVGAPTASSGNGAAYLYEATGVVSAVVSGSQTYGSSLPSFTYTDDAPSSLAVTGTPACTEVETATAISASLGAGSYSLDGVSCSGLSLTGPGSGGYAISYGGAFAVAPAPLTITASSRTMAEGGPVPAITPSYSGFVLGQGPSYLTTAPTCSTTARSSSAPGSYPATCSGAVDPNYAITYVAGTVTVEATTTTTAPTTTTTTAPTTTTPTTTTTAPTTTTTTTTAPTTTTTAPTTTTTATVPPPLVVVTTPTTTTTTMTTAPAPPPEFPGAAKSYPNGAIVSFGGAYYVFAGGRAFSVPKAALGALGKVDHAKVVTAPPGATPPTGAPPRPGTLVTAYSVDHDPTIYVEGTDTKLHGFASLHQFLSAGFDPALVVTVAGLGNAPVSATTAGAAHITALSTRSDGALAISGHTWYVFAGGRAFGISTPAGLAKLRGTDTAKPLVGEVTPAEESAVPADGVLLSVHSLGVFVAYRGELFGFKAMAQLFADGYGGTAAVPVPGTGALPVVFPYSGS